MRSNGKHPGNGHDTNGTEKKTEYNNRGAVFYSRKWLGGRLSRHPGAFTVYFHLLGWSNHAKGKLKPGQIALGERDFGERIGMSITTVRKWLRWLRDHGWILLEPKVWGKERGTIVTVLRYIESQSFSVYKQPSEDQKMILTPASEDEDQKLILTLPGEDQKLILNPPDRGSIIDPSYTPNSLRDSGAAPQHSSTTLERGEDVPSPNGERRSPNGHDHTPGNEGVALAGDSYFEGIRQRAYAARAKIEAQENQERLVEGEGSNSHAYAEG